MGINTSLPPVKIADLADGTDGELITWDASGNPATVAVGTAAQVLTSNGVGAAPTFQAAAGGSGQTLVTRVVAASGGDHTTLGAAITAASNGDVIYITPGTYSEGAITTALTQLSIIADNPEQTVLNFTTNNFTISGTEWHLRGFGMSFTTGILSISGTYGEMINCHFEKSGSGSGTSFFGASCKYINNFFKCTSTTDERQIQITGNYAVTSGNRFEYDPQETTSGRGVIEIEGSYGNHTGNHFLAVGAGTGNLLKCGGTAGQFTGNTIYGGSSVNQLCSVNASAASFAGNTVYGNSCAVGLFVDNAYLITGNNISGSKDSIQLSQPTIACIGNYITGGGVTAGYVGIDIIDGMNECTVHNNYIFNTETAINVGAASRCSVVGNYIDTGVTTAIVDGGTTTIIEGNTGKVADIDDKVLKYMKNTSGGQLVVGDLVVLKAAAGGDEFTTTTSQGDDMVYGMVAQTIADTAYGLVQVGGKTTALKVDGTTAISVGDPIGCYTSAGIGMKAAAGDMSCGIALEAYSSADSNGVIDCLLYTPRKI